tara:strand:- start:1600 stop:2127 length:528 start_codon:yes stop_codon:yes gene_type:complete
MKYKSKSQKRIDFIDLISEAITHDDIFGTINYKNQNEDQIKQFIYPHLVDSLAEYIVEEKGIEKAIAKDQIKKSLKWEGNVNTTVNHILFMGTQNRPDMVLEMNGLKIAIEFKRGGKGSDLRSGFGQSMVYATHYDFVLYLFVDTTDDKRIFNATTGAMKLNSLIIYGIYITLNS